MLVVDASVAVEYLLRTSIGQRIASTLESSALIAPALLDAEVLSVLRRASLSGRLAASRAEEALDDLRLWDVERLALGPLLPGAWRFRENVSAYDALYLSAARLHRAPLLTADGPLARAPSIGVVVQNVRT